MKRLPLLLAALLFSLAALAQSQNQFYLFPGFVKAHMVFRGNASADAAINFDALHQTIYYMDGNVRMEMTNMQDLLALNLPDRSFVMHDGLLCEVMEDESGHQVLVNWKFKNVNKGSKGALGATTQAHVEVLHSYEFTPATPFPVTDWHLYSDDEETPPSVEIWQKKNDNTYFVQVDGQTYRIKRLKDLYKAFPDHSRELKAYAKEKKLTMQSAEDAFKMFDRLYELHNSVSEPKN